MSCRSLVFSVGLFLIPLTAIAQTVDLPDQWLFRTGDSLDYAREGIDESGWKVLQVPSSWEKEGFDGYDGIAWYRLHFTMPKRFIGKGLYLLLGKVDDADETFLNGVLIGSTGRFPPEGFSAWDSIRTYKIPLGVLRATNVLAIRVYDMGGPGGMVGGPMGLFDEKAYAAFLKPVAGPRKSFYQLVTSNGLIAAVYDEKKDRIEAIRPHIFQAYDSAFGVQPFLQNVKLTVGKRPLRVSYKSNTHVIEVKYAGMEVHYFAPFSTQEKILYAVVSGKTSEVSRCSFASGKITRGALIDSVWFDRGNGKGEKYYLFGYVDSLQTDSSVVRKAMQQLLSGGGRLLRDEIRLMRSEIERCRVPRRMNRTERAIFEQSITVLKMAQVSGNEVFPAARGQILASLPPGVWNITWVRDGMYAVMGMNRLELFDEARKALSFFLSADVGYYIRYVHTDGQDYGVGRPYRISVCRYFGTGKEESDFNEAGPNIELDGFGLFLIAFCDYVNRSGDSAFFRQNYATVTEQVADVIVHSIDTNDVIRRDSGPWERHLPGKQFAYTSIACAAGLRDFAGLSARMGATGANTYRLAYERLLNGIRKELVVGGALIKSNVAATNQNAHDYFDAATFEAFGFRLFTDRAFYRSHLQRYEKALRVPGIRRGFSRVNRGDWYDSAEWVFLDLRIAAVMRRFGNREKATRLLAWVTDQARLNFNLIPELFDVKSAGYEGAVPMVGFGAGAYILALFALRE